MMPRMMRDHTAIPHSVIDGYSLVYLINISMATRKTQDVIDRSLLRSNKR